VGEEKKIQKNGQGGAAGRTGRMRRKKISRPPPSLEKIGLGYLFLGFFLLCVIST